VGSKKGRQRQEGMTTGGQGYRRAGEGYGPAEHRLMGYDRERLGGGGGIANRHTQEVLLNTTRKK